MNTVPALSKAVFIDRDGVINDLVDRGEGSVIDGQPIRWTAPFTHAELRIKPNVRAALELMRQKGYLRIVVTNQPDVAGGRIDRAEFDIIMADILALPIDDCFVCPHRPDAGCACRKPSPGMILEACAKHGIDPGHSFMIGDSETDIQAGRAAGTGTILVSGLVNRSGLAQFHAASIMEAAQLIP